MSLIARSAHFKICPRCGEHGRIILADGRKTSTIMSKEAGRGSVETLLGRKDITPEEALAVKEQINAAPKLREEVSYLDEMLAVEGSVVLMDHDPEDTELFKHMDFILGQNSSGQRGEQTMH